MGTQTLGPPAHPHPCASGWGHRPRQSQESERGRQCLNPSAAEPGAGLGSRPGPRALRKAACGSSVHKSPPRLPHQSLHWLALGTVAFGPCTSLCNISDTGQLMHVFDDVHYSVCMYMHPYTYMCVCVCRYAHTHTHTSTRSLEFRFRSKPPAWWAGYRRGLTGSLTSP